MRVDELRHLLNLYPGDLQVALAAHTPAGSATDVAAMPVLAVTSSLNDEGVPTAVWLLGIGELPTALPALFSFMCRCGQTVVTGESQAWPHEHLIHLIDTTG